MPETEVIFYQERPGKAPVVRWLKQLKTKDNRGFAKCAALIQRLAQEGYELRRPAADYLEGGIYELRVRQATRSTDSSTSSTNRASQYSAMRCPRKRRSPPRI